MRASFARWFEDIMAETEESTEHARRVEAADAADMQFMYAQHAVRDEDDEEVQAPSAPAVTLQPSSPSPRSPTPLLSPTPSPPLSPPPLSPPAPPPPPQTLSRATLRTPQAPAPMAEPWLPPLEDLPVDEIDPKGPHIVSVAYTSRITQKLTLCWRLVILFLCMYFLVFGACILITQFVLPAYALMWNERTLVLDRHVRAEQQAAASRQECCHPIYLVENKAGERTADASATYNRWEHASIRMFRLDAGSMEHMAQRRDEMMSDEIRAFAMPMSAAGLHVTLHPTDVDGVFFGVECRWACCLDALSLVVHDARLEALADAVGLPLFEARVQYESEREWRDGAVPHYLHSGACQDCYESDAVRDNLVESDHHVQTFAWDLDTKCVPDNTLAIVQIRMASGLRERIDAIPDAQVAIRAFGHTLFEQQASTYPVRADVSRVALCFYHDDIYHDIETQGDEPLFCVDDQYIQLRRLAEL